LSSGQLKLSSAQLTLSSGQLKLSTAQLTLSSEQLKLSSGELTLSCGHGNVGNSDLERGTKVPNLTVLLRISHAFGVSVTELLREFTVDTVRRMKL